MPRGFFRFLAVLLLALIVPLHGAAAVMGAQCIAFAHHEDGAGQESHGHDGGDGHDHASHAHADGGAKHGDEGGKKAHCGPCTACCASASIAGPVGHSILSSSSYTKYVFSQSLPLGVPPDGLYRPPLAL